RLIVLRVKRGRGLRRLAQRRRSRGDQRLVPSQCFVTRDLIVGDEVEQPHLRQLWTRASSGSALVLATSRLPATDGLVELHLADPDRDRGDLDALVLAAELQRLLQRQLARRNQLLR